jgi:parallel beta-helix repeat protein
MNLRSLPRLILLPAGAAIVCACMVLARADEPMEHTLYVAPGGDNENPGTRAAPLRTIGAAARAAGAGTTVRVAPGIYRENIKSMASGSAAARIRYVSTVKWGAKIIGGGTEAVWENRGKHVEIAGFDVSGSGRAGILNYGSWVRIANNRVHDLALSGGCSGNGGGGIINADYKASDGEISGNVVHDIGVPGACPGVHGIYYANSRGNIYNNIIYRASAWGIHLWHAADQVVIANNTVFANGSDKVGGGIIVGTGDKPGGVILTGTKVINNIVVHNPHASIRQFCYPGQACIGAGNVVANNVVYANGGGVEMLVGRDTGTIVDDPLFVDFRADGTGDYRLRRGSPALRRGLVAAAPPTDIEGARRSHGAAIDIGAYQNR